MDNRTSCDGKSVLKTQIFRSEFSEFLSESLLIHIEMVHFHVDISSRRNDYRVRDGELVYFGVT